MSDLGIPAPPHVEDPELRRFLYGIYRNLQTLSGSVGATEDRALLVSDLTSLGILGVEQVVVGGKKEDILFDPKAPAAQSLTSPKPILYEAVFTEEGEPVTTLLGDPVTVGTGVA